MAFLYATATVCRQRTRSSLTGALRFFYEMYGDPDFYGVSIESTYASFIYSKAQDPLGSLDLSLSFNLGNQPGAVFNDGGIGYRVLAGGGYSRYFNRGSRFTASLKGGMDNGSPMILFSVEASYGIAPGSFVTAK